LVHRKKRITASKAGAISKMRNGTKRANKVKELINSKFHGTHFMGLPMRNRQGRYM